MVFDHVSVEDLHNRLGIAESFRPPPSFGSKPLRDWRMETEDSLILRFIYRNLKPNRHLEFGTWTGAGARCVLDESEATVWTINLPSGEFNDDGRTVYHSRRHSPWSLLRRLSSRKASATIAYQSDALGHIGKEYIEANLGHRVCQIYCDSRDWDTSQYPAGFFDSVLVDGGHTQNVVLNDTKKGLAVLRRGGLIAWHDYVPHDDIHEQCESVRGVATALHHCADFLKKELTDVFWIDPSWLLIGIKA